MWASFTSGTFHFLKNLTEKHPAINFRFMRSNRSTVVYYEHQRRKSIFTSGKTYKIIKASGDFTNEGYITMEYVPVTDDGIDIFENRINSIFPELINRTGVTAIRVLKNNRKNEYVVVTQWKNKRYEELWRDSPFYEKQNIQQFAQLSAYFADRPFTNSYYMIDEDDNSEY